jgi:hypothetical protein
MIKKNYELNFFGSWEVHFQNSNLNNLVQIIKMVQVQKCFTFKNGSHSKMVQIQKWFTYKNGSHL